MAPVSDAELLELVNDRCTIEDVKGLLRTGKGRSEKRSDVKVTAEDKATLINTNLADALTKGSVTREEVLRLVRDAEENGDQHVFYFEPKPKVASKLSLEAVGTAILGKGWRAAVPSAEMQEGEYRIADLRAAESGKSDWIAKLYGVDLVTRHGAIKVIDGQRYIPIHEKQINVVLMAQWRAQSLLELRVPRDESRRRVMKWVAALWSKIAPGVSEADFKPWDLTVVRRKLLEQQSEHAGVYATRDTRLWDEVHDARATFEGHVEAYDLIDVVDHQIAVERLLKAGNLCTHLGIKWLVREGAVPSREIHTLLMGERAPNEMVISGHCQPTDVDYITGQLRRIRR